MNPTPPVSIIIVNYNAGQFLTNCVVSGLNQAREIIIIDNASSDNSLAILESTNVEHSKLKIIRNTRNLGFAAACNIGTNAAKNKYLLYLNPDCLLHDKTTEKLLLNIEDNKDIGMTGGLLTNPDGTEQAGGRRAVPTPWRSFVRAFGLSHFSHRWPKLFYDFHLHKQPLPQHPMAVEAISGACMMIKRDVINRIGQWDEKYFLHCEDLDLCMRIRQAGLKILFIPDAPIIHYLGICSSRYVFVEWHKHKGMMKFYRKFFRHQYPGALMWLVATGIWLRFGGIILYRSLQRLSQ